MRSHPPPMVGFKIIYTYTKRTPALSINIRQQFISNFHQRTNILATDRRKTPDLIDFCIIKGISEHHLKAESHLDLISDHSPIITTLNTAVIKKEKPPTLSNVKINSNLFREILSEQITCKISLKSHEEIENAMDNFTSAIQRAAWKSTPDHQATEKVTVQQILKTN